jgi:hydroxyethylthiazole kinase-like uncharacterized protein yjeF
VREKHTNSEYILGGRGSDWRSLHAWSLHNSASTRAIETQAIADQSAHVLMQKAGLAIARLAMANSPHAEVFWIACGTGNNAGDGFFAAIYLKSWGKKPVVTKMSTERLLPPDAAHALRLAIESGVQFEGTPPTSFDVAIDAIYGIGKHGDFNDQCLNWIALMNRSAKPILAVDIPTGLNCDSGEVLSTSIHASVTLSLLTLKPGLFTAKGRDASGDIWFNNLDCHTTIRPYADLNVQQQKSARLHDTHKGSFGDVAIIGGAPGMTGAALLAANAALHGGAGRIFLALLQPLNTHTTLRPEFMRRDISQLPYEALTVVAGCGGAEIIAEHLSEILMRSRRLVLDADALNAISASTTLQLQLSQRPKNSTVLTPHPLEAARLASTNTASIQSNRLYHAQKLSERFSCTVVLKGSGSIIASPDRIPRINTTGNAKLAIGGSGDVLAGLIGAYVASETNVFEASSAAAFHHGQVADNWPTLATLTPQDLSEAL